MTSTQGSQTQHNAAWRAFWIKIRELNARAMPRPEKTADLGLSGLAGAPDGAASPKSSGKDGGGAKQKSP